VSRLQEKLYLLTKWGSIKWGTPFYHIVKKITKSFSSAGTYVLTQLKKLWLHIKEKPTRQLWTKEAMIGALRSMLDEKIGYYKAAQRFKVPQTTLENRMKKLKSGMTLEEASSKGKM
jgi:hypothetical protein